MNSAPPVVDRSTVAFRLGWVSFFNDVASETLGRTLPLLLVAGLGSSALWVGVIEGSAESVSILLKGFSGWVSDRLPSRKPLVVGGYVVSALSRLFYFLELTPGLIGVARVLDRVGKGVRTAPRDAMIADASDRSCHGKDFGIMRFLDTIGAVSGIALVFGNVQAGVSVESFRRWVLLSIPAAVVSLLLLVFWVPSLSTSHVSKPSLKVAIPRSVRSYLFIVAIFALSNSSDAFLVLRARELGLSLSSTLVLFLFFNALAAAVAVPAGRLSDRFGRVRFLALGWAVYVGSYFVFATGIGSRLGFVVALLSYGAFYGLTEGVEKALLADQLSAHERGAGFGAFQMVLGISALVSSLVTGAVMTHYGSSSALLICSLSAFAALLLLLVWSFKNQKSAKVRRS